MIKVLGTQLSATRRIRNERKKDDDKRYMSTLRSDNNNIEKMEVISIISVRMRNIHDSTGKLIITNTSTDDEHSYYLNY